MLARILIIFLLILLPQNIFAAKKRVFKGKVTSVTGTFSTARLSRATNSVVITFPNLGRVRKVTYTLSYTANGIPQGVVGSLVPSGQATDSRDLYFGTCSKGVCTPHYNIKAATLTISTQLTTGATRVKRYRIKV